MPVGPARPSRRTAAGGAALCESFGSTFTSLGYNYANETANSCNLTDPTDSSLDTNDALLGPLTDNGGPTPTHLPQTGNPGSPLIDAIPNDACQTPPLATGVTTDQRGLPRPEQAGGACDIGAVEVQRPLPPKSGKHDDNDDGERAAAPVAQPVVSSPAFTG
jgi:hypothetical protein